MWFGHVVFGGLGCLHQKQHIVREVVVFGFAACGGKAKRAIVSMGMCGFLSAWVP